MIKKDKKVLIHIRLSKVFFFLENGFFWFKYSEYFDKNLVDFEDVSEKSEIF